MGLCSKVIGNPKIASLPCTTHLTRRTQRHSIVICMNITGLKTVSVLAILAGSCLIAGCGRAGVDKSKGLAPAKNLGTTVGSLAEVATPESIPVEGYGLVAGLSGTGSPECPSQIRAYLVRYIQTQLPKSAVNVEKLISSTDTAVVQIEGTMPAVAWKNQYFDVKITALPGTRTTSLEHGWLYTVELKARGTFGMTTRVLANAEGPVFIDKIDSGNTDKRVAHVLAGGKVLEDQKISLELRGPDFRTASAIRNRLNERFGVGTAEAVSPARVELTVPAKYRGQEQRFIVMVRAVYLDQTPEVTRDRIMTFVKELAVSQDKQTSEIALETIGSASIDKLGVLLSSSSEEVRLRAARCMLNLGGNQAIETLRQISMDKSSAYRLEALRAIAARAGRDDAPALLRRLLLDSDFNVKLAAYEQLRELDDRALTRELIGRTFFLEQIAQSREKAIFVSRSGQPRVVLFGAPISCHDNIFVQSAEGDIILNAPAGQKYVSLIRKHPKRPGGIAQSKSSFELADIIRTLCEEPSSKAEETPRGLGVSYADVIALLKQMCEKGAVGAEFRPGPLPKIG